jgi:ATP/maltotriose-dependent transcriptional regulator MalT
MLTLGSIFRRSFEEPEILLHMDRDDNALAALKPVGPLPDAVAEGWKTLNLGEWERARDQFETALAHEETPEAWEGLAWAAWWLDEAAVIFDARERAYRLYRRRSDRRGAARAATWLGLDYIDFKGESAVANGWLRRAHRLLEKVPPSAEHAWLSAFDAHHALMADKNPVTAQKLAAEAAAISEALGITDVELLGRALEGLALVSQGKIRDGMRLLDEATAAVVSGELTDLQAMGLTCCYQIYACERVRDYARAAQWCDRVKEFCRRWRCSLLLAVCRTQYAGVLIWRGEWAEADAELTAAARELSLLRPALAGSATARLAELRRRQGRWEEALRLFQQVESSTAALLGRAELALDQGDAATAVDLAERYLRRFAPGSHTERASGLDVLVRALAALGDLERARKILQELESTASAVGTEPLQALACFAGGIIAASAGDHPRARASFEDAVDLFSRCSAPFELGRARLELGRALATLDRREAAAAELRTALTALQNLGAAHEAERAALLLRESAAGSTGRPSAAISHLTEKELEVLRLAAQGLTDKEIAARLHRSEHTIHRHVANILTRLNLPSRTAAVAYALREGVL